MKLGWSIVLGGAFVLGSLILGTYLQSSKRANAKVTVKGLSEQTVKADLAWWSLSTQVSGNSIEEVKSNIAFSTKRINAFLASQGFKPSEFKTDNISVYSNNYREASYAYTGDLRIVVNSSNVDLVDKASQNIAGLIEQDIFLNGDKYSNGPKYFFTKFTDAKPEMIAKATAEAKKAAEEFAKNSGSDVGSIAYANQGVFQILPANRTQDDETFHKEKLIRVVTTIDYFLK